MHIVSPVRRENAAFFDAEFRTTPEIQQYPYVDLMSTGKNQYLAGLGGRMRKARESAHERHGGEPLTQATAADLIRAAKNSIARYERGEVSPTAEVLMLMAVQYRVSADWLLTGEGQIDRGRWGVVAQLSEPEQLWLHMTRKLTATQYEAVKFLVSELLAVNALRERTGLTPGAEEPAVAREAG